MKNKMKLSIVILNYNTSKLVNDCLESIKKSARDLSYEIIVVDNGSTEPLNINDSEVKIIRNRGNFGFAKGNNQARKHCRGEYILFLNSDTLVHENTLQEPLKYVEADSEIGALGVKTVLPSGELDKDARRSFPTPWVAFSHFSGLDRIFPKSSVFARYWYGYKSGDEIQEVDVLQGAYLLVRKEILDQVGWFSEDYFMDAEDIDLCWKIKSLGYKIVYYPKVYLIHLKKATKKKVKGVFKGQGVEAMEIFYRKRLWDKYPLILNWLVIFGIRLIKVVRTMQ